jgi:hypothetical protein
MLSIQKNHLSPPIMTEALVPLIIHNLIHEIELTTDSYESLLKLSTTLYIGNLNPHTTETQLQQILECCGIIKALTLGLNRGK